MQLQNQSSDSAVIRFRMTGEAFRDGMPLHLTLAGLECTQHLLDKTYLSLMERHRVKKLDREMFFVRALAIERGSLDSKLELILRGTQMLLPFYQSIGPDSIWSLTKNSFEYLKLLYDAWKNEDHARVVQTVTDSPGARVLQINISGSNFTFDPSVASIAPTALPYYQQLAELALGGVDEISLGKLGKPEIVLRGSDVKRFETPTYVEPTPIQIDCEIFTFNKFDGTGKLIVAEGQALPIGKYKFALLGNQDSARYIEAMMHEQVKIRCLVEHAIDPLALGRKKKSLVSKKVFRLQVVDVTHRKPRTR